MEENFTLDSNDAVEKLKASIRATEGSRRAAHIFESFDEFSEWVQIASGGETIEAVADKGADYLEELLSALDELSFWVHDTEPEEAPDDTPAWEYMTDDDDDDDDDDDRPLWAGDPDDDPYDSIEARRLREKDKQEKIVAYLRSERLFTTAVYMAFTPPEKRDEYDFRKHFMELPVRWFHEACVPAILPLTDGYLEGLKELHRLGVEAPWVRDLGLGPREPLWVDVFDTWEANLWPDYASLALDASLGYSIPFAASLQRLEIPADYVAAAGLTASGVVNRRPNDLRDFLKYVTDEGMPPEYASALWQDDSDKPTG